MADERFDVRDLIRAMGQASIEVKREVSVYLKDAAEGTASRAGAAYPVGPTGNLSRMVFAMAGDRGGYGFDAGVALTYLARATAPHVHIVEYGTVKRAVVSRNRVALRTAANRGRMPKLDPNVFVPIAMNERGRMMAHAQTLLSRDRELI